MKNLLKRGLIICMSILFVGGVLLISSGNIGTARAVAEAEDNCKEDGYYMYCEDINSNNKIWVDLNKTKQGDKFVYLRTANNNTVVKLFSIN